MKIVPIPAFRDNYIWALVHESGQVAVVDPGDAGPVEHFLAHNALTLTAILITHHHSDHTGGIQALCRERNVPVYGPAGDHIPGINRPVQDGATFTVLGQTLRVMAVPGHTLDHLAYVLQQEDQAPALFCGDTLFAGGCGRLFEGSAEMMYTSLRKICALPDDTRVYCAHEYTLSNLAFARLAEPDNPALISRLEEESDKRARGEVTLPSTISLERRTNPFLRCHTVNLQTRLGSTTEAETFALLRQWKDRS